MGWLSGDKDKTQDQSIGDLWKWIEGLNKNQAQILKNQAILVKNNDWFIHAIKALQQKDSVHDKKDAEHDALIQGIKTMAKSVEQAEK